VEQPETQSRAVNVVLAIPDELLENYRVVDFVDKKLGAVHRDLRRALKAELMKHRLPTQILLQRVSEAAEGATNVDHRSRCAWNLFTGLYFKAGGIPWAPSGLQAGTCYVGISFYRPLGDKTGRVRTSVAQAFDEHGEGIVLRGQDFAWDESQFGRSPHLDRDSAFALVDMVLRPYSVAWPDENAALHHWEALAGKISELESLSVDEALIRLVDWIDTAEAIRSEAEIGGVQFEPPSGVHLDMWRRAIRQFREMAELT
jgi:hypothetical protein